MNAKTVAFIVILLYNVRICQSKKYNNFTLFSAVPKEPDQLKFLQNLSKQKYINVMFWKKPSVLYEEVHFIVSPSDIELFLERASHFRLKFEVRQKNIERAFEAQTIKKYSRLNTATYTWSYYHNLDDIYQWLQDMALQYPNTLDLSSIGKSVEGRDIYAVSIKRPGNKFKVIVEGGIHGDEWIAVEFVTYLINELVGRNNSRNWRLHDLAKKYDWYIIPIVNPDGYFYTHTTDRLWRKNRRGTANAIGVDLNRNFDYNFGKFDTSEDPKDENYCGPRPFSEPESRLLADFITERKQNLRFYFSFHAYGQKFIIPFSDRINHIDNYNEMENFGKQAILNIYNLYGTKYGIGTTYDTLGLRISGNSASWVKKTLGVRGIPVENVHLEFFKNLTTVDYVNFWRSPGQLFKPADFIVDPEYKEIFQKDAANLGLYITTIKEDVQQAFDKQTVKTYIRRQMESFDWNSYFRLDDIYQWLRDMAKNFPEEMEIISIGTTHERREILAVKILLKHSTIRSKVIVEGGIHAREWISPAFVTYFINKIIHAPVSNDPILKNIALTYEWYFVPVLNADGYEYSHTHRMAHATRTFSFDQNEKGIIIKSSVANPVDVNPKMMLSQGGNMSNDPCNRLGVTTNRQIT
ncbi:hypothetical protein HF086_013573 [Spodoptera exigua]|uniref:Peptidase M14 domain-containing protein n=1 Tax=Spodoptera exigua TaxID=7107 RepID=A0A922MV56_SPOEX|nr:hypothetical protein HF086_013573 [Spodoptera exigua]